MKTENNFLVHPELAHDVFWNYTDEKKSFSESLVLDTKWNEDNLLKFFSNCLIDPSGRQFACIHEHCHELNSCFRNELLYEYLDFHELHFYSVDRLLWCRRVYPDILQFIDSKSSVELADYRLSFNHRYIRKDGCVSQFLHEGNLIYVDDMPQPVLNLKVFSEIGDIKSDESIVLSISQYSADLGYQKILSKIYSNGQETNLTQRELEIIKLCQEGLSSKMIADKLNLSIHTVKNHKRNCMEKTFTHNITELIHLCIQNHWL